MSLHSDDQTSLTPSSDSFWEPGNFKRTTKRIEDGSRLCDDLMKLVHERSEIEKTYAKSLKMWNKKWNDLIEKGPEYGTTEAGWKGVLAEADRRCELHLRVRDNLINDVHSKIKSWQKENFHKSMMQIKEKKDMDDMFKKAQKPWAKLLDKVNKTKAEYHGACKQERTALHQERNANADPSGDAARKLADRVQKAKEETTRTRERYETALSDLSDLNGRYMEDMTDVFNKCQDREAERLAFFKETMFSLHRCLNISTDPQLPQIYQELESTIGHADQEKDLRWWSNSHGVNMPMNWPAFEEYSEEFREITSASRVKKGLAQDGNITLINQRSVNSDLPEYDSSRKTSSGNRRGTGSVAGNTAQSGGAAHPQSTAASTQYNRNSYNSNGTAGENVSAGVTGVAAGAGSSEDWDEYATELVDNGEPGVPVKAIYDYEGLEDDELTFKAGDRFEKLEDEDEQGWCKGRLEGRVGLYPANYVQTI